MAVTVQRSPKSNARNACYDRVFRSMSRALITFVVVLFSAAAAAQSVAAPGGRWHGEAVAPLPGLPAVSVDLGEPGPYVSTGSAVLDLHATAAGIPFNGYIGIHLAVGKNATLDVPLLGRAVLAPRQSWSLRTSFRLEQTPMAYETKLDLSNRELVVEWRDRSMRLMSQRTVGTPPWTEPLPLRVTGGGEPPSATLLGQRACVRPSSELSDRAEWYRGFAAVAMPVAVWLDLPLPVRQALFGSSIRLLFFGAPRETQAMSALDRAAIPVTFRRTAGSYTAPWPYSPSPATVTVPVSWQANPETRVAGPGQSPFLVTNGVAAYAAEESALARPIPAMTPEPLHRNWSEQQREPRVSRPTPADIGREYRPALVVGLLLLLSVAVWLLARRHPRLAVLALTVVAAGGILAFRSRIRPVTGVFVIDRIEPVAPGVVRRFHTIIESGPSPLAERPPEPDQRTAVSASGWGWGQEQAQVVTSRTLPSQGASYYNSAWAAAMRRSFRQELGVAPAIHIRSRDAKRIVLDYESPIEVDTIRAGWFAGERVCHGDAKAGGSKSGSVTIESGSVLWSGSDFESAPLFVLAGAPSPPDVVVVLIRDRGDEMRTLGWMKTVDDRGIRTLRIGGELVPQPDGMLSCLIALPPGFRTAGATISASVSQRLTAKRVTLSGPVGSRSFGPGTNFDAGELAQFAHDGNLIQLTVEPDGSMPRRSAEAWVQVSEKRP
jgi:hypothetical protein